MRIKKSTLKNQLHTEGNNMKEQFTDKNFKSKSLALIGQANEIIEEYQDVGLTLTLRQLYYQFVARDLVENTMRTYKTLGSVINDARLAGLIDWKAIEDRTRFLRSLSHWETGEEIIQTCANTFRMNKWDNQEVRPEVWIEKDALLGVLERPCEKWDVPYFSCRGYASQSELYNAGSRCRNAIAQGQRPIIIHLGDHDPSGIDMTRDNEDRLEMFVGQPVEVRRIALNINQVQKQSLPPNPAKLSDSRATGYIDKYGASSWELDALDPIVLSDLITDEIAKFRDPVIWDQVIDKENDIKDSIQTVADDFANRGI